MQSDLETQTQVRRQRGRAEGPLCGSGRLLSAADVTDHQRWSSLAARQRETSGTGRLAKDTGPPIAREECGETVCGDKKSAYQA